jgi:hypothetical protein
MIQVVVGQAGTGFWSPAIIAAIINAGVAIATGTVVGYIAWRQSRTARNKLALDLFAERFKAWKSLEKAFGAYVEDSNGRYMSVRNRGVDPKILRMWVDAESDTFWLFGPEVFGNTRLVGDHLAELAACPLDEDDQGEPFERLERFETRIAMPAYRAFVALRSSMEPYMMLDNIAVNRPVGSFRWPWEKPTSAPQSETQRVP